MMRKILILAMFLTGCETPGNWYIMRCEKGGTICEQGTVSFTTKEDCEVLAKAATEAQPNVLRICAKSSY